MMNFTFKFIYNNLLNCALYFFYIFRTTNRANSPLFNCKSWKGRSPNNTNNKSFIFSLCDFNGINHTY